MGVWSRILRHILIFNLMALEFEFQKKIISENYKNLLNKYGDSYKTGQWGHDSQKFRFEELIKIGDLNNKKILDFGCGIGDFVKFLEEKKITCDYVGVDFVPELISFASKKYPNKKFYCVDVLDGGQCEPADYIFISGVFNNKIDKAESYMQGLLVGAFASAQKGLVFNFTSNQVNFIDSDMQYFSPDEVLKFCRENLSPRIFMKHRYHKCDVCVYVYKE